MTEASKRPDRNEQATDEEWREQYPIDTVKEQYQNRRQFLKTIAAGSACLACGQMALLASEPAYADTDVIDLGSLTLETNFNDIANGESILFNYPNSHSPCVLVKVSEEQVHAYSQKCTHLACPIIPKPEEDMLYCPCHNGAFDLETGNPLFGPPKRPLPKVSFEISDDGQITVLGMEASS